MQIIAELDEIYAAGWRGSIFFVDDNFIGNKGYLKTRLLPELIEWRKNKKGCVFFTESSINLADDPELIDLMVEAGFDSVFIGIESPDEASLKECHKHQNRNRDLLHSVKSIHRSGLQVMGGFIVGFDSDLPSIFQRQIDFIQNSGIVIAMVGMLQAPPGTGLFERLRRESRVVEFFSGDNVDGTTNIIPRWEWTISVKVTDRSWSIFTPRLTTTGGQTLLRSLRPLKHYALTLTFLSFSRAAPSTFTYLFYPDRVQQLALAVTLSIYGPLSKDMRTLHF